MTLENEEEESNRICSCCKNPMLDGIDLEDGFCPACHETHKKCVDCNESFETSDGYELGNGAWVCANCIDTYSQCDKCDDYVKHADTSEIDGMTCCESCAEDAITCDDCGCYTFDDHGHNDRYLCASCAEHYFLCGGCDLLLHEDYYGENGICQECLEERDVRDVHGYSYKPDAQFWGGTGNDHRLYLGIELETETHGNETPSTLDKDFVYMKSDSSLNDGIEFVGHPMTWDFIQERQAETWKPIFDLAANGYRSYNTTTCGMHVHLSRDAFSTFHLFKFLQFFYQNPQFILDFSRRRRDSLARWASVDGPSGISDLVLKAKCKYGCRRYECINLCNTHTVEVRIFRGTLHPDSFLRNLEFLVALYEYTKDVPAMECKSISVENYRKFVLARAKDFPRMAAYFGGNEYVLDNC